MSGSSSEQQRGLVVVDASLFFVLTLDIPLRVVFHAPAPLHHGGTSPSQAVNSPGPSRSASVAKLDRRDLVSRDRTPETVRRRTQERGCVAGRSGREMNSRGARCEWSGSVRRVDELSRPRSRSVCAGKYCSVGRLSTCRGPRPQSATSARHHRPTERVHVARQPTVDDDDAATTSSSALVDSGVTSSVTTSRDASPRSRDLATDADRQRQLRRFLDALSQTSSGTQQQQHGDVTDDDSDSDTRRASLSDWQDDDSAANSDDQSASAMDQVRQLVARCRLPVCASTPPRVDALQRRDAWTRAINHHSTHPPSVTSESLQQAILAAAADLVGLCGVDESVARQLLTLSRRIQAYKLQLYSQHHRDVIDSASRDADDVQPAYVDLDLDRSQLPPSSRLVRCGITRCHLQRHRRFSVF